jgi:hypothetical protein
MEKNDTNVSLKNRIGTIQWQNQNTKEGWGKTVTSSFSKKSIYSIYSIYIFFKIGLKLRLNCIWWKTRFVMIRRFGAAYYHKRRNSNSSYKTGAGVRSQRTFINKSVIEFRRFFKFLKWKHAS